MNSQIFKVSLGAFCRKLFGQRNRQWLQNGVDECDRLNCPPSPSSHRRLTPPLPSLSLPPQTHRHRQHVIYVDGSPLMGAVRIEGQHVFVLNAELTQPGASVHHRGPAPAHARAVVKHCIPKALILKQHIRLREFMKIFN